MKERHWEAISKVVGFKVEPYEGFNFQTVIDMDLIKWKDQLEEIGERAAKEYNIETTLNNMMRVWEGVEFHCIPFKNSGTFTCTGFDDAMNLLDEQIIVTQAMQYSPFKGPFVDVITDWSLKLLLVSDTIE